MIPVFQPEISESDIAAVVDCLRKGEISGSFGEYIPRFEREFAQYIGMKHGIACSSGTTALHMAVAAAGIGPGDEVLVSASTNIATALAVLHNGAVPVPVDSEAETWNLDLDLIAGLVTPRTKAIIPVHLFGHPVDMDKLTTIANKHSLMIIEDCAESHGAEVRGRRAGTYSAMSCFSFYANKIMTTGEGGMVLTNDDQLCERLRLLRNLGFTKPRFYHEIAAFNFRMTGMQGALGTSQLTRIDQFIHAKRELAARYNRIFSEVEAIQTPAEKPWAKNVYWMYGIRLGKNSRVTRDELMQHLTQAGIETRTFFCPMNQQPCLQKLEGYRAIDCPVADDLWQTGLYLPSGTTLSNEQIDFVAQEVRRLVSGI